MTTQPTPANSSRRDFVRAAAAAVILPAALARAQDAKAAVATPGAARKILDASPNTTQLKIGLIGTGGRGTGACTQALKADKNAVLWAVGDLFPDRVEAGMNGIAGEFKDEPDALKRADVPAERRFSGWDNYKKVIDSGVDVVILTSYPNFRPIHLKAAVEAGKHVFAEKPVAVDSPGLRSVLESARLAQQKKLACMVGFCWRYNEGMRATFDQILKGTIGDIVNVQTTYLSGTLSKRPRKPNWSDSEFQLRNWWHFTWTSGDHIVEQAIHSIDRMSWALGDRIPKKVICLGGRAARNGPEHGNVYDHFAATYEYEGGLRAVHTCRQIDGCPSDNTDYVYGSKGSAIVNGWQPNYTLRDLAGKELWKYTGPTEGLTEKMYQNEHDELFASIRSGKLINDLERGAQSTMLALMARYAAYTGQAITWDQAMNSQEDLMPKSLDFGPMEMPPVAIPGKTKFA